MMENQTKNFRQGDVIIKAIDASKMKRNDQIATHTLAEGEQTGHSHTFRNQDQVLIYRDKTNAETTTRFLEVSNGEAVLEHQEHKAIHIPEGTYEVTIQKEYNPFLDRMTQVHD